VLTRVSMTTLIDKALCFGDTIRFSLELFIKENFAMDLSRFGSAPFT
jgi:hypothetical protein